MQQAINFVLEIDKLKGVDRKTRPLNLSRQENSAEHSWQIALLAMALAEFAEDKIDIGRVVGMLLVHDIGEIDVGDTLVYVEGGWEERKAAELTAVRRIFSLLPDSKASEFLGLWQEFESETTSEAKFANAVDRAMPVLLNLANNGQSWLENNVSYKRVVSRIGPQIRRGCPRLWDYLDHRLQEAKARGFFATE